MRRFDGSTISQSAPSPSLDCRQRTTLHRQCRADNASAIATAPSSVTRRWNTENLMKRPRLDVLGVSTELERQLPAPYIVGVAFEDAQRFGGRPNGSDAELIQPALERGYTNQAGAPS